ncbi:MAG: ATP-binding cassette domain-containing protein [Tannerella sp.]|jgi:ABC-2 type transport system ATP-binding protein|nr:ATP-binding cassette domain-containing protein [Tannerella sp.]
MGIIQTENLCFDYRKHSVLENVNINIPEGAIYGYLGKNGAGKSTTIKLLLGLLTPAKGKVLYKGMDLSTNRLKILGFTGNLIEAPSFYPNLTGYENLKYMDMFLRHGDKRIAETLALTGLTDAADRRAKHYSTGMKQRLGIAMAMLNRPEILILDEPVNGLDPEGIHEVRELILRLQSEGKTIFLSSHLLSEIEKICTHIGILNNKSIVFEGTKDDLMARTSTDTPDLESVFLSIIKNNVK